MYSFIYSVIVVKEGEMYRRMSNSLKIDKKNRFLIDKIKIYRKIGRPVFDGAQNALFHPPAAHIAAMSRPSHIWS